MTDAELVNLGYFVLFWAGCAILTSYIAGQKGHPRGEWFAWGAIFGIFAVVAAFATKPRDPIPAGAIDQPVGDWACSCGAQNPAARTKCYRCGLPPIRSDFVPEPDAPAHVDAAPQMVAGGAKEVARLAELHAAGHLSDDEFTAAKKRALGL